MPWKIVEEDGQHCVYKEDAAGNPSEKLKCYDDRDDALAYQRALYANEAEASELVQTVALSESDLARPVEFLRIGTFIDANGRKVEIDADKLNALVASFEQGEAGQDIPIDILHERKEAAGWVRSVYRQGDKLLAVPDWNNLGRQLVGDKVYRYLSATIDLARNVLRSISLVNFPAVKGLQPVELAENEQVSDPAPPSQVSATDVDTALSTPIPSQESTNMADEQVVQTEAEATPPPAQPQAPASAVLSEHDRAALRKSIEAELRATLMAEFEQIEASKARVMAELMEQVRSERELSEFAHKATTEGRYALPVKRDDLQALLSEMDKPMRRKVMDLLTQITERGLVDFTEHGTSRGTAAPQSLPTETATALRRFLADGGKLETFFAANPELGAKASYDLKEYDSNG